MCVTMSSSRWESSKQPLYVKSVWMNGSRHIILSKEDPVIKSKYSSNPSSIRSKSGKQSARSKSNSNTSEESLMIPAVQLLLANVHCLKQTQNKPADYPIREGFKSLTYNVLTHDQHVKIKNVDVEVNLTPHTKQYSVAKFVMDTSSSENKLKTEHLEQCANSLTERVLLWLDLAGRYTNEIYKNHDETTRTVRKDNRIATAHSVQRKNYHHPQSTDHIFIRQCTKNIHQEQPAADVLIEPEIEDHSILKGHRILRPDEYPDERITSQVEIVPVTKINENVKISEKTLCKRQVHIFMPHLKKINDTNSIVSESTGSQIVPDIVKQF